MGVDDAKMRILVVDDNVDAAETLGELLAVDGHEVRIVYDGVTALAMVGGFLPNLVLLDIGLPHMDGWEVVRRMRAMPELTGSRLVALTGFGQEADKRRALKAGFDMFLVKPVDWEALRATLRSVEGTLAPSL